jgi:hypothetical protein
MKTFAALITALLLAMTAAACGSGNDDGPDGGDGNRGPTGQEQLVRYTSENGLAQTKRVLEVRADGKATLSYDGKPIAFDLTESELAELRDAVVAADFPNLQDRYEQSEEVYDAGDLTIASGGKEVLVLLPSDLPEELEKVVDLARAQIEKHKDDPAAKEGPTKTDGRPYVPGPSDNLLAYERSGGVGGTVENLYVDPNGEARVEILDKATRFKLTPEELRQLKVSIGAANFQDLNSEYGPPEGTMIADGFITKVTAEGRTVTVETEGDPPPVLQNLMNVANDYIERYR